MKLEGRIWKDKKSRYWLAEVADLGVITEGTSRKDAVLMLADAIEMLVDAKGFSIEVDLAKDGWCTVKANNDVLLVAFMLRRLRTRERLTVRQVSERLKSKSPNAYAQYETGKVAPSMDTLTKLLAALNPKFEPILRVI
jgi:predicted RNase H-like HicB family nuclease/DNA-binding XRE family transcriptional regulator